MKNTSLVPVESAPKREPALRLWDIPARLIGILLSGAMPVSGLAPFGLSFLTIDRQFSLKSIINLICVAIGYTLLFDFWLSAKYIAACVLFEIILFVIEKNQKPSIYFIAGAAGCAMLICETGVLLLQGFTVAGLILALCDTVLMMVGSLVFSRCRTVLLENRFLTQTLSADERISLCALAGVILLSAGELTVLGRFNVSNFLACVLLGAVALGSGGVTRSASIGIFIGIIQGLSGDFPESVAVFTLIGLTLGAAAQLNKAAVCLCLCLFGFGIMLYAGFPMGAAHLPNLYELVPAAAAVYLLPRSATLSVERILSFSDDSGDDNTRFKEYVEDKLGCISESFMEISNIFDEISEKPISSDMTDISLLFDTAADRVCKQCDRAGYCWQKDFNATYNAMFKFLEIMERNGALQLTDVPKSFADKCIRLLPLVAEINRQFEVYKVNIAWKNKLRENRELTAEQFRGISEIIKNASEEICSEKSFDIMAADEIKQALCDMGINAERVDVIGDKNGRYSVEISINGCDDFELCRKRIKPVIKKIMGISVATPYGQCEISDDGRCRICFCQLEGFEPIIGCAALAGGEESGDKSYVKYLPGGKMVITISDGMGKGHSAARESDTIIRLLGSFLEAGFDKGAAVKLINSVMVMRSARDAFATIDMCVIDLYTGQIEFIKNGAEASYIKRSDYTEAVRSASLPIGIISINDIETFSQSLSDGSLVVMMSDGVITSQDDSNIRNLIERASMQTPPDKLAQLILSEAVANNRAQGIENDDMTVVCIKLAVPGAAQKHGKTMKAAAL